MHLFKLATRSGGRIPRFLLAALISAGLIISSFCFIAQHAKAAATACQDGATVTVAGTIYKVVNADTTYLFIRGTSLACDPVFLTTTNPQNCVFRSQIQASGTLTLPVFVGGRVEWSLTNPTFSCQ
jgi:hypothetical protein